MQGLPAFQAAEIAMWRALHGKPEPTGGAPEAARSSGPPPVASVARQIGRASDGGSEGTALADPKSQLAFPPRSASRNEEMEKGLASAFVIRWPIWPSGPRRE
jgi:hypothetical protein